MGCRYIDGCLCTAVNNKTKRKLIFPVFLCLVLHLPEWRLIVDADLNPTLKFEVLQRTQKILSLTRKKNSFYLRYRLPSRDPALVRSTIFPQKLRKVYHVWYQNFQREFSFLKLLVFLSVTARLWPAVKRVSKFARQISR